MNKKKMSIIATVTLGLTLVVNVISTFGLLGVTPVKLVSDKFTNLLVPMGYTFSVIWTVIYAGLLYYTAKELVRKEDKYDIYLLFMFTNVLNVLWIVTFTGGLYFLSVLAILGLLVLLYIITSNITDNNLDKIIFSIYTAWILVASVVSITSFIISLDLVAFDSLIMKLVSILMLVATTIVILINRNNMAMKLTYVFALAGIAANHIFKFNFAYPDMMIVVGIVVAYVLYALFNELFEDSSKEVRPHEAL